MHTRIALHHLHPAALAAIVALLAAPAAAGATYTVTNTNDSGAGSLRQAILQANTAPFDTDRIVFNIAGSGVKTITPSSPLSAVLMAGTDFLEIDATTQPGYAGTPLVEISGVNAGPSAHGFTMHRGRVTLRGFTINRFAGDGVHAEPVVTPITESDLVKVDLFGCWIGTDRTGTAGAGNGGDGVDLLMKSNDYSSSHFGDAGTGQGNVISGNAGHGIRLTARGGRTEYEAYAGARVEVKNCYIGTSRFGLAKIPNGGDGIRFTPQYGDDWWWPYAGIHIGGSTGERNVISGNEGAGIAMDPSPLCYLYAKSNFIGLGMDGMAAMGNGGNGITMWGWNCSIGGPAPGDGNLISSNGLCGIEVLPAGFDPDNDSIPAIVQRNQIGTSQTGTVARGNKSHGISSREHLQIGTAGAGNLICANGGAGVRAEGAVILKENRIGVTPDGHLLGNDSYGVWIHNSWGPVIGSFRDSPDGGNIIGGNGSHGIYLTGTTHKFHIGANCIGTTPNGDVVPNGGDGIRIVAKNDWPDTYMGEIGNTELADGYAWISTPGNRIANNTGDGIALATQSGNQPSQVCISRNEIWNNGQLGIDLGPNGVTENDAGDADSGPNSLINCPSLTLASPTRVGGTLNSLAGRKFRIELFRAEFDPSRSGEGRWFLGALEVTTDAQGNAPFLLSGLTLLAGQWITATATQIDIVYPGGWGVPTAETSEFAANIPVGAEPGDFVISPAALNVNEGGAALITVQRTGGSAGTVTVDYLATSGTATAGSDFTAAAGTLTFAPGVTTRTITIPTLDDNSDEPAEAFTVAISNAAGGALIPNPAGTLVSIMDNDAPPAMTVAAAQCNEGNAGGSSVLAFNVTLTAASAFPVSVNYATGNDTADAGIDYTAVGGTLNFAPGEKTKTITVPVIGDLLPETDERLTLTLSAPVNATPAATAAVGTILDDDQPGTLQFSASSWQVGEIVESKALTVTRTAGNSGTVTVNYAVTGGTATVGDDYMNWNTSGTLTFTNGQTSKTIAFILLDDVLVEGEESINVQLSNPNGGAVLGSRTTAVLTILDDDTAPSISGRVMKSDGTGLAGATVSLSGEQNVSVTADWNGHYAFSGLTIGQSYTVTAVAPGFVFTPDTHSFSGLANSEIDRDFTGSEDVVPELHMTLKSNDTALLYWPVAASGWTLVGSSSLAEDSWLPVTGFAADTTDWHTVTVSTAGPRKFFRLARMP